MAERDRERKIDVLRAHTLGPKERGVGKTNSFRVDKWFFLDACETGSVISEYYVLYVQHINVTVIMVRFLNGW